jgi:hypothetical protein
MRRSRVEEVWAIFGKVLIVGLKKDTAIRLILIGRKDGPAYLRIVPGTSIVRNLNIVLYLNDKPTVQNTYRHSPGQLVYQ